MASPTDRLTFNDVSRIAQAEEKSTDLAEVRRDFYPALREYIRRVKAEGEDEIRKDPYSIKANGLQNEIKKAQQKSAIIFEKRMRKIMLMAIRTSFGAKLDLTKLTEEERSFYDSVLEEVKATKSLTMDGQAIATRHSVPVSPCAMPKNEGSGEEEKGGSEMVLVRILDDIPPFIGGGKEYCLSREEMAHLPSSIGCALVKNGKAVEVHQERK